MWNGYGGMKATSTIWHPSFGDFLSFSLIKIRGFFAFSIDHIVDEGVQKSGLDFNWKRYVRKHRRSKQLKP
jgi:hypothetical protein